MLRRRNRVRRARVFCPKSYLANGHGHLVSVEETCRACASCHAISEESVDCMIEVGRRHVSEA